MKKVAVIILNFKVTGDTIECINSVQKSDYENIQIIVVNNSSKDGLEDEIKKLSEVIFIQNKENLGFTGGNNIGIKYALISGADYIFILNPDTEITKSCISTLVNNINEGLPAGRQGDILGPKIYFYKSHKIWYAGGILDKLNVIGKHRGVDEIDKAQYNSIEETDYVSGAALFTKKEVFDKIGFFDENYFLYYEDSDFCMRAKKAGFKILYIPEALVYHKNARSTGLGSPLQDYFITRNRMLFAFKFLSIRTKFAIFREALKNIFNSTRRLAFFDFLTGNFGKGSYKI